MIELVVIGVLAGMITAISPCILPVLPAILLSGSVSLPDSGRDADAEGEGQGEGEGEGADGTVPAGRAGPGISDAATDPATDPATALGSEASASVPTRTDDPPPTDDPSRGPRARRRPLAVVGGLVVSFSLLTLLGSWVLELLHLPQDTLERAGLVVLAVLGVGLLAPPVGLLLERPFARLGGNRIRSDGGGLILGLSLGLVFVPCAGPVLAALAVVGATHRIGWASVVLTVSFAVGVAVPLLVVAVAGDRLVERVGALRARSGALRRATGAVFVVTAVVLFAGAADGLQTHVPGYTSALQHAAESDGAATQALRSVTGEHDDGDLAECQSGSAALQQCGVAPALRGISGWLHTPGGRPLSLTGLRGHVVLVDFWTYSCINCQRTLPHVEAWYRTYHRDGLEVIGVHTPEFAFEHVASNVRAESTRLGVGYPVALDNRYATWDAYQNEYWPAEYLIDATGQVRHVQFGEGDYAGTESLIRTLLTAAHPGIHLPPATETQNRTPTEATSPETYLGYDKSEYLAGQTVVRDTMTAYSLPAAVPLGEYALGGRWSVGSEAATSGPGAALTLAFQAEDVYLVLGGTGAVTVRDGSTPARSVSVSGPPALYQLVGPGDLQQAQLRLTFSPGVRAYDFTFG